MKIKVTARYGGTKFIVNISHEQSDYTVLYVLYVCNLYGENGSDPPMTKLYKKYKTVENISSVLSLMMTGGSPRVRRKQLFVRF